MNRLTLTLGLATMDTCWVAAWAILLGQWTDPARPRALLSAPSVLVLVVLGALSTQVLGRWAVHNRAGRFGLVGLAGLAVLGAVRVDQYPGAAGLGWLGSIAGALVVVIGQPNGPALAFALGLFSWWRGVRVGSQMPSFSDVESVFGWGTGLNLGFALLMALATRPGLLPTLEAQTAPFVVGFFYVSLMTLALGRLESLRTRTRALAVNTQWLGVLVLVSGVVILAALVVAQLLSFDLLMVATRPIFDVLGWALLLAIYLVVIPLAYVVEWLVYLLLSLLRSGLGHQPPQVLQPADVDSRLQRFFAQGLPPELLLALKTAGAGLLLLAGMLAVARAVERWRRPSADADARTEEERDSLWEAGRLWRMLLYFWWRLFGSRTPGAAESAGVAEPLIPDVGSSQRSSIRELYRLMVQLGESVGATRSAATTPLEHLPALQTALEPAADASHLTQVYLHVRYAELEPSPAQTEAAQEELRRLRPRPSSSAHDFATSEEQIF